MSREKTKLKKMSAEDEGQLIGEVRAYGIAHKKSRITFKAILIMIICLLIIAAAVFGGYQIFKEKYTDAIDNQIKILNDRNTNLDECLVASVGTKKKEFVMEYGRLLTELYGTGNKWQNNLEQVFNSQYKSMESSFGNDFKVDYKVISSKQLTDDERNDYMEDARDYLSSGIGEVMQAVEDGEIDAAKAEELRKFYEEWYNKYQDVKITDGYSAIVNVTYASGSEEKVLQTRMIVVRVNGEWMVKVGGLLPLDTAKIFENMTY